MKTFEELYQEIMEQELKNGRKLSEEFDAYPMDCLLHPKDYAPVIQAKSCDSCEGEADCQKGCVFDAIKKIDGRIYIDPQKCTGCGVCVDVCKMGRLIENREIYPVMEALCDRSREVYALIAPAFAGQYGAAVSAGQLRSAFKKIGFTGMVEVATFADILTLKEALEFDQHVLGQGDVTFAVSSSRYAWLAVLFSALSILLYFFALNCSHLAAFRTATNMRKEAVHHIVTLPLGYFDRNASGRLRKIIDDNAGLTEGFLAHQLPDLTGAVVMPVTVLVLIFLFDWRLGICCLIPMAVSVFFLKQMMGGDNAQFMSKYMTALEGMNKEAVEYIRGIPVVKVFQQTIYSFKNFHAAIEEYQKFASGYALKCRIPLTGFTVTLNGTFVLLIPAAMLILSAVSSQAAYTDVTLDFLFYSLFTPVCATMMNRIMFASEQLMAAKSAVSRVEAILQEEPLPESDSLQIPKGASVVFRDVSFSYPGAAEKALDRVSFDVDAGEFLAIMGASGSGKTTLLNCISTIDAISAGKILLDGVSVADLSEAELAKFRRERLGFVFQDFNLLDTLTVEENIGLALSLNREDPGAVKSRVREMARKLGISDILEKFPYQVSGGQKQRAAVARAMVAGQSLLLADEPTGALDSRASKNLLEIMTQMNQDMGATILMVTHDAYSASYAKRVLFLKDGRVFNELLRGDRGRPVFYHEILDVLAALGGDVSDVI